MKATMQIVDLELPPARIQVIGGAGQGTIGHSFDLKPTVKVQKRTAGAFSGEGIECPRLEWNETIEWFEMAPRLGGHRGASALGDWRFVGKVQKNMYAENPNSNTFKAWHSFRYFWAAQNPPNAAPPELVKIVRGATDANNEAKHWIAKNGLQWVIPELTDRPAMGLAGGSGGGGGASLVTSNTRRRVIYFDLGFSGYPKRVKFVQILESVNGVATIHKFIPLDMSKFGIDNESNLQKWRAQVNQPTNFMP